MSAAVAIAEKRLVKPKEKIYTLLEYLAHEERSQDKHEFINGKIVKMPGSKANHNEISANIIASLKFTVKPLPKKFRILTSDQKIYIAPENRAVYADALVVCEKLEFWEGREDLLVNPLLIVEVASRSTRGFDRGDKFLLYEQLPSFLEYVLVEQNRPQVETWFREKLNTWNKIKETDLDKSIELRSLGVSISLADIYENIEFLTKR
jgi:Uma2 family endonuclease